jgi:integrase
MGSVRARRETGKLFMDFVYQGRRCREQTSLPDSTKNRKKLREILERVEAEITIGTFDYSRYFPNSKLEAQFAANAVTTPTTSTLPPPPATALLGGRRALSPAVQTPLFRDLTREWYAQHEIEWRRSYRPTVQGTLDQHLIPCFGEMDVGRIMKEDILNFRSALGKVPGRKSKDGLSAQRINHVMGVLRRVLEDAADRFHFTPVPENQAAQAHQERRRTIHADRGAADPADGPKRTSRSISWSASPPACAPEKSTGSSGGMSTSIAV